MSTVNAQQPWDAYEQISEDSMGEEGGVNRQRQDLEKAVASLGGLVEMHHLKNNTSAYPKRRVTLTNHHGNTYTAYRVMRPTGSEKNFRPILVTQIAFAEHYENAQQG